MCGRFTATAAFDVGWPSDSTSRSPARRGRLWRAGRREDRTRLPSGPSHAEWARDL